jgi:RNA-directed DNA polymerase
LEDKKRSLNITREEVDEAWRAVSRAAGGPGLDGKTIKQVALNQNDELYKVWNRMSSGSYQAQAVKIVMIPKVKGGMRKLGVPQVTDRVAQTVVKNRLEKIVEQHFHEDSYGYRVGRSAIEAVLQARKSCMRYEWVVEIDIKSFFDELDHELLMEILKKYTEDKVILLYSERFLKAEGRTEEGETIIRDKGTPQGGVVSPVLANLFLHEAFDKWMEVEHSNIPFERYADDIVIHCVSERQAYYMKNRIEVRLGQYKLKMNQDKTRIVYTGTSNKHDKRGHGISRKFTFLGYDFKPRDYRGRTVYTPAMGEGALKMSREKVRKMRLDSSTHKSLEEISQVINKVVRGWINYYGHCRRSELYKLAGVVNERLIKWVRKKHKTESRGKALQILGRFKAQHPKQFVHWYMISFSTLRAV